jgi:L-histidine Nalpha-methyltransferase
MSLTVSVAVHPSQFPGAVQRELIEGLRQRRIPPKFHYLSYKQSEKWLALHNAWSPSRTDLDCATIYDRSFVAATSMVQGEHVRVVGLGCGSGQKEARLMTQLAEQGKKVSFTACDVSLALVLTAREEASRSVKDARVDPLLCDLAAAGDLGDTLTEIDGGETPRIITFFGMIPNLEPDAAIPRLAALARPEDVLLVSANLAPGADYEAGMRRILPGYANTETRDWLLTFIFDIGIEPGDDAFRIGIEDAKGLKRIVADYRFSRDRVVTIHGERIEFRAGESLRLFFSYRYTPEKCEGLFASHGLKPAGQWITKSGEEVVFAWKQS